MQRYKNYLKGITFFANICVFQVLGRQHETLVAPKAHLGFSHSFPFFNFYFAGSLAFFLNFAPENKLLSI